MPAPSQLVINVAGLATTSSMPILVVAVALGATVSPFVIWITAVTGLTAFLAMLRPWGGSREDDPNQTEPPDGQPPPEVSSLRR